MQTTNYIYKDRTFNRLFHVFNAVHCFSSLGWVMSLEDEGTHGYFPKDRGETDPETRTPSKFGTQKLPALQIHKPQRGGICTRQQSTHLFLFSSRTN